MVRVLLISLVFINGILSFAQNTDAKLFFHDGETLDGYGEITNNNKIKFRLSHEDELTKFDAEDIYRVEFYGFEMSYVFEYHNIDGYDVLLEVLTEGEVTLFAEVKDTFRMIITSSNINDKHYSPHTLYLLKSKTTYNKDKGLKQFFKSWKKKMIEYFKDCDELVRKIKDNEFNRNNMIEIVEYYNDFCTEL